MNRFYRTILIISMMLLSFVSAMASPNYPFEGLLPRAKVIFVGRVATHNEGHVTFAVSESLRGRTENRFTLAYSSLDDRRIANEPGDFLVLSQGDDYWGKPAHTVSLGQKVKGQISYLGWIAFPIKMIGSEPSVDLIRTMIDHKPTVLSLERAKTLIREVPFKGERNASNKSLDRSGGSVFRIKLGAAQVE
jgi:hypothetical protein